MLDRTETTAPKFDNVFCSQCGREFGPGDHGYSHCSSHRGVMRRSAPTPSPLDAVVKEAARKLASLQMTKLSLEPEQSDVNNVIADLDALCMIFDGVIAEVGRYAGDYFGLSAEQVKDYFHDQLRGSIEGNATFVLQEAFNDSQESKMADLDARFPTYGEAY